MPTFCRHNRFLANCPICTREQAEAAAPRRAGVRSSGGAVTRKRTTRASARGGELRVRRVALARDDGYRSPLVPGVKASDDAERLAEEIAFAATRLVLLATTPPGLYAEVATAEPEEATWLAFLIAYLGPLDGEEPFAGVEAARTTWASGELPRLGDDVPLGSRTSHDPRRGDATLAAYRAWAERAGSQVAAFSGEAGWTPERRFARVLERLALPGLRRDARYDLLVTLGQLGVYELKAATLVLGGDDDTTVAAKRVFGIGDTMLLERRAAELAEACEVPLAALDLALWNWYLPQRPLAPRATAGARSPSAPATPARATGGFHGIEPDADVYARVAAALGL